MTKITGAAVRAAAVILLLAAAAWALAVPEAPQGRVSDYAGLLEPAERDALEARLAAVERESGNQIAVAVFESLEGGSIEEFSIALAEKWKIGQKGKDNGILLVLFPKDRKVRIEVGYGLEERVTDALSGRVIRDVLAPPFREGRYAAGITAAVDTLARAARGDDPQLPAEQPRRGRRSPPPLAFALGIIGFSLFSILARLFRHRYTDVGGTGGADSARRSHSVFFWPGGFGGGGRGGFGGGGFSGGGGGFGGGGASGGW